MKSSLNLWLSLILFFIYSDLFVAQKASPKTRLNISPYVLTHTLHLFGANQSYTEDRLHRIIQDQLAEEISIKKKGALKTSTGSVQNLQLIFKQAPIVNAMCKILLDKKGNTWGIILPKKLTLTLPNSIPNNTDHYFIDKTHTLIPIRIDTAYTYNKEKILTYINLNTNRTLFSRHAGVFDNDSLIKSVVYKPNPIVKANTTYGALYQDFNDQDNAVLTQALDTVLVPLQYQNGLFKPKNKWVELKDISPPTNSLFSDNNPPEFYTRSDPNFENFNILYHISKFHTYLDDFDAYALFNEPIIIDAHGNNGEDNSFFTPSNDFGASTIIFGDGGVDDAEDAHVIIHEYAHFLSHLMAPESNLGIERQSLDEGFGDYLASSYSKDINPYRYHDVFSWDGHNEFWDGRITNSTKNYDDLTSSIYENAEIWSSTLMDIQNNIGRSITDQLVFESMFGYFQNMRFKDAARLMVSIDSLLYKQENRTALCSVFAERKIYACPISEDNPDNILSSIYMLNTDRFYWGGDAKLINFSNLPLRVNIYTPEGKMHTRFQLPMNDTQTIISAKKFSKGLYILQVVLPDGKQKFFKLLNQKAF